MRKPLMLAVALVLASALVARAEAAKVFVTPFADSSGTHADWVNKSIQQSLSDELALTRSIELVDQQNAAQYTVSGNIQRNNGELRISGRVQDSAGKNI